MQDCGDGEQISNSISIPAVPRCGSVAYMNENQMANYRRRGDSTKCPVCGTGIDPSAYRCPKCRVYFCFKCRIQLRRDDKQFECVDQQCDCYGKLLCANCSPPIDFEEPAIENEHKPGAMGPLMVSGAVVAGATFVFFAPLTVAAAVGAATVGGGAAVVKALGGRFFEENTKVETTRTKTARCCIQCKHPVKQIAGSRW